MENSICSLHFLFEGFTKDVPALRDSVPAVSAYTSFCNLINRISTKGYPSTLRNSPFFLETERLLFSFTKTLLAPLQAFLSEIEDGIMF